MLAVLLGAEAFGNGLISAFLVLPVGTGAFLQLDELRVVVLDLPGA